MPYKISGSKNETTRVIIIKESDWSIESNTVISGSGAYEIEELEAGDKLVIAQGTNGDTLGYGAVAAEEYIPIVGNRAVFAGGSSNVNTIDYIAISVLGNASYFGDLTFGRKEFGGTSNGVNGRGVFGGGGTASEVIDYITFESIGDATDFGDLLYPRTVLSATSNRTNERGIFGGHGAGLNYIDYITISTPSNAQDFGDLIGNDQSVAPAACSNAVNNRGIFAGGFDNSSTVTQNRIQYVTITSTSNANDFGDLTVARFSVAGCSNGTNDRGVFGGGRSWVNTYHNVIDYITISSTGNATNFGDLLSQVNRIKATSNGTDERGIFIRTDLSYITINSISDAQDFGDLTEERSDVAAAANA